ncbi:cation diffusion facilitator family transporter [Abyssalbus ytuae]|uniref:Cation diffusion facilitator family transporter n=1 Tax=Abyssalbus ytuae TaxID=2926907 RepID=A0A9E7CU10_9FLAO|nr:cation diffusion facilitator family transporter [Abyssalbus ytuae]UOB19166.1 cation diffusion facilitator family transporter [Abyssalbus ytuae]
MKQVKSYELPEHLQSTFNSAKKTEWITIIYLFTVVILMYVVMGSSQAMKTAWLEDALGLIPAISFLVASRYYNKAPNRHFPYGYHRVYNIAFLCGALALFTMGCFLVITSIQALLKTEHPSIGSIKIFGEQIWLGWIMILVLLYSSIPAIILGRKKLPMATKLHNKILYTDATTQKADYMTAFAAIAGVIGIGFGLWWADATAALFISFSVLKDGISNLKTAVLDLLNRRPVKVKDNNKDEIIDHLEYMVKSWQWVEDAKIRLREEGQVYCGEIKVIAKDENNLVDKIEKSLEDIYELNWKLHDITIMPVKSLRDQI